MTMSKARRHEGTKARRAFSLVEVLLAIIILGIGVISIAALFPAGIAQQRLAADDLMGPVVADHAISIIRSKVNPDDFGTFEEFWDQNGSVSYPPSGYFTRTIAGDWGWMRPSFFMTDDTGTRFDERGAIDIFSHRRVGQVLGWNGFDGSDVTSEYWDGWPDVIPAGRRPLRGIPFNRKKHTAWEAFFGGQMPIPPRAVISQRERYYPMVSEMVEEAQDPPQPQYVWDCMFRRYQGRVFVAVFVYRVSAPGAAATRPYVVQSSGGGPLQPTQGPNIPPIPIAIDLVNSGEGWNGGGPWDVRYENMPPDDEDRPIPEVFGFPPDEFDPLEENQSWQAPRQWILDQNNNVHRVVSVRKPTANDDEDRMVIELTRPLTLVRLPYFGGLNEPAKYDAANDTTVPANNTTSPPNPPFVAPFNNVHYPSDSPDEYFGNPGDPAFNPGPTNPNIVHFPYFDRGVVTRFWYIPLRMEIQDGTGGEFVLTPVYIAVKEL